VIPLYKHILGERHEDLDISVKMKSTFFIYTRFEDHMLVQGLDYLMMAMAISGGTLTPELSRN